MEGNSEIYINVDTIGADLTIRFNYSHYSLKLFIRVNEAEFMFVIASKKSTNENFLDW